LFESLFVDSLVVESVSCSIVSSVLKWPHDEPILEVRDFQAVKTLKDKPAYLMNAKVLLGSPAGLVQPYLVLLPTLIVMCKKAYGKRKYLHEGIRLERLSGTVFWVQLVLGKVPLVKGVIKCLKQS